MYSEEIMGNLWLGNIDNKLFFIKKILNYLKNLIL